MTDVSVVIPTRDRPALLSLALYTALQQRGVVMEVLVVDDGTCAGTAAVVDRLRDPRVHLLRNAGPQGVSGARNTGIAAAAGQWIAFLDDDDVWAPTKLGAELAAAQRSGAGWVYAGDVTIDDRLCIYAGAPPPAPDTLLASLQRYNAVPAGASNVVVHRDVVRRAGFFDPALRTSEDWDFWLRLARIGAPACVPHPLVAVRTHARMASRACERVLADIDVIARRHRIPVDRPRHHRWAAWTCLEDGRRIDTLRHYGKAAAAGDVVSLGRALVALVYPRVARRSRPAADEWIREAQAWLDPLRASAAVRAHDSSQHASDA